VPTNETAPAGPGPFFVLVLLCKGHTFRRYRSLTNSTSA
jgi:hypothetical protein